MCVRDVCRVGEGGADGEMGVAGCGLLGIAAVRVLLCICAWCLKNIIHNVCEC
jgi:hypothetical protein